MRTSKSPASLALVKFHEQLVAWEAARDLSDTDVLGMLREAGAPECPLERVGCLRAHVGRLITARRRAVAYAERDANRPKRRDPADRIAAAVAELRRAIPEEIEWLGDERDSQPEYRHSCERELSRLRRLLAAAQEDPQHHHLPDEETHPRIADPDSLYMLLFTYELVFGRATISRSSPAVQFIALAIKRIGWDGKTDAAVAQALLRGRNRYRSRLPAPNS